jgi:hypothetical protein
MTDDPRAWDLPYEPVEGDPIPLEAALTEEPIFVDAFTFRGGTGMSGDGSMVVGIGVFTFWNSSAPDTKFELLFVGPPTAFRSMGDIVRNGARHVANRIEGR